MVRKFLSKNFFIILVFCLNEYIKHYEILNYRPLGNRQKRSLEDNKPVHLRFHAINK